jgi:hypothetical protein
MRKTIDAIFKVTAEINLGASSVFKNILSGLLKDHFCNEPPKCPRYSL